MRGAFYYVGCNMLYPEYTLNGNETKTYTLSGQYISCIVDYSTNGTLLVEVASDNDIFVTVPQVRPGLAVIGGFIIRKIRFTTTDATGATNIRALISFNSGFESVVDSRLLTKGNTRDRLNVASLDFKDETNARGLGYYLEYNQTAVPAGGKTWVVFTCPADKYVILTGREIDTNKELMVYKVFTQWSGGTLGTAIPAKSTRNDTAFPSGVIFTPITGAVVPVDTDATRPTYKPYFGTVGQGNTRNGVNATTGSFRTLAPNSQFLIEWHNQSGDPMWIYTALEWFELPAAVIP